MTLRLANKIAIVTGGGAGFGAGIAKAFAAQGAKVLVSDINAEGGRAVAASNPSSIAFHSADVTKQADWEGLLAAANEKFGSGGSGGGGGGGGAAAAADGVGILVNNAGTTYPNKPTLEVSDADFDRCFDVNVRSLHYATRALMPHFMARQGGGVMLNIASIGATRPRPGLTWYNASKAAVANATLSLAAEYGKYGIRVNSLCPLLSGTGLFEAFSGVKDTPENRAKLVAAVPLGRLTEVEDVANTALFMCSDEASFFTGQNVVLDGGKGI